MKMDSMMAVLKALQGKCYEDMADEKTSPDEKLADAIEGEEEKIGYDLDGDDEAGEEHLGEVMPEDGAEILVEEEDPDKAALKEFFKTKKPPEPRPGTAVMFAVDRQKKPVPGRKSMKDLMNG